MARVKNASSYWLTLIPLTICYRPTNLSKHFWNLFIVKAVLTLGKLSSQSCFLSIALSKLLKWNMPQGFFFIYKIGIIITELLWGWIKGDNPPHFLTHYKNTITIKYNFIAKIALFFFDLQLTPASFEWYNICELPSTVPSS